MEGRFPACSRTGLNVISVVDLARGLVAVSERGVSGERYVLGHENLWLEEFLARVAAQVGRPPRAWVPWPVVAAGGLLGTWRDCSPDTAGNVFAGNRVLRPSAPVLRHRSHRTSPGWRAREDLDGAIRETVEWFSTRAAGRPSETPVERGHCAAVSPEVSDPTHVRRPRTKTGAVR